MADNDATSSQGGDSPKSPPAGPGTSRTESTPIQPSIIPLDVPVSVAQTPGAGNPPPQDIPSGSVSWTQTTSDISVGQDNRQSCPDDYPDFFTTVCMMDLMIMETRVALG